jgi:hypothetical protein
MSPPVICGCALCSLEARLLSALSYTEADVITGLFKPSEGLHQYSSVAALLAQLKALTADRGADDLLRELLKARPLNPPFVESVLVLAFLPTLHITVRRVSKQQSSLTPEDIVQQALSILLQYLRSDDLQTRQSHFAFAISRAVKRKVFEWAQRESRDFGAALHEDVTAPHDGSGEDSFERCLQLRHFLDRCVAKKLITDSELNLLIEFKLDGGFLGTENGSNGNSTNAVRQKLKRLLRKLRRLARERQIPVPEQNN